MHKRERKKIRSKLEEVSKNSRFTVAELSLIANTFFDRDEILMAIRKFFLQGELDEHERQLLKLTPQTIQVVKKQIMPEIDPDAPFYQVRDLWTIIDTNNKLVEDVYLDMVAQNIAIKYLRQMFDYWEHNTRPDIKLKDLVFNQSKDKETAFVELRARNTLLVHIDANLENLRVLAISNAEVEEEEKLKKLDSNQ